jgi:hypothetical protein
MSQKNFVNIMMQVLIAFWFSASVYLFDARSVSAGTPLSDLANSLQPGQWAQLTAVENTGALLKPANGGNILEYNNRGAWDPTNKRGYFCGASHHGSFINGCVYYNESTNSFIDIGLPAGFCTDQTGCEPNGSEGKIIPHGYDHSAFDSLRGEFYQRIGDRLYKYSSGRWSSTATLPGDCQYVTGDAEALEYFPELDRLIFLSGYCNYPANNALYDPSTNSWSYGPGNAPNGGIHGMATYSRQGFIYAGCGNNASTQLSRLGASGGWTAMATPPSCLIPSSHLVADPASGRVLVFVDRGTIRELNPETNTWRDTGINSKKNDTGGLASVVIPVNTSGVIMMIQAYAAASVEVWVYKHATSSNPPSQITADITPPSIPTNLTTSPTSTSQISLLWAASTDNVGVAGYELERCQGTSCTNFTRISTTTEPSFVDPSLAAGTSYQYRVRARDAVNNFSSYSAIASATTPSSSSTSASDFSTRCSQPGVIKCVGFDSASDLAGTYGSPFGVLAETTTPSIDTTLKASGNGSLKFSIPAGQPGGAAGSYFTNFSNDLLIQFGENAEFYIQYRVRMTPEYIAAGNFKVSIIGTGDKPGCTASTSAQGSCYSSCTALEVVVQTPYDWYKYPTMYNSCTGSASHGPYDAFQGGFGSSDYTSQNARPSPYCLYSQTVKGQQFPPTGNCFGYFPHEWMTFQIRIKTGPRVGNEFTNSYVDFWMARDGKPSEPVISWGPYNLSAGSATENQRYGKIWLLPYSGSAIFPTAATVWYDDLIISRSKIADPGSSQSGQPPAAPTSLVIR